MSTYLQDAVSDAQDTARNFVDDIHEAIMDNGEASDDLLNDYGNGDSYHHESHVDKAYNLQEAAELLDELDDYEETDEGLWQGQKPRDAISTQAAFTYGNAVYSLWRDLIKEINEDSDVELLKEEHDGVDDTVQGEYDEAKQTHEDEQEQARQEWEEAHKDEDEHEDNEFEEAEFAEPFDVDDEIERRKEELSKKILDRINEIIDSFEG